MRCANCLLLLIGSAALACAGAEGVVERETRGDTTIVRTRAGTAWGGPREAVVDLSIGSLEGPVETMFGNVRAIVPDDAGGVYVYDSQVPAIRYFDASGRFVRQVGRRGEGPGEYRDAVLGMAIRSDGRLQIRDARNGRVTMYEADGAYSEQWIVASGLFTNQAMFLDEDDHTYLKVLQEQPRSGAAWKIGLLHYDQHGRIVDTIPDPWVAHQPAGGGFLTPSKQWTFGWDGSMIVGVNDTYRFEVRRRGGEVIRVERETTPLRLSDAEHAAYEERREHQIRTQGRFMTTLPGETPWIKPAYREMSAGRSGRVWVRLYAPVEPQPNFEPAAEGEPPAWPFIEPKVFDVFGSDGTYLGQVYAPHDVTVHVFGDDVLWGVRIGELGEQYVVRLRVGPMRLPTA